MYTHDCSTFNCKRYDRNRKILKTLKILRIVLFTLRYWGFYCYDHIFYDQMFCDRIFTTIIFIGSRFVLPARSTIQYILYRYLHLQSLCTGILSTLYRRARLTATRASPVSIWSVGDFLCKISLAIVRVRATEITFLTFPRSLKIKYLSRRELQKWKFFKYANLGKIF